MKYILLVFLALTVTPAFAQDPKIGDYLDSSNPSLVVQEKEIPYSEFNKVSIFYKNKNEEIIPKMKKTNIA